MFVATVVQAQTPSLRSLPSLTSLADWERERGNLRAEWERILGGKRLPTFPLRLEVLKEETLPTVVRQYVRYQTEPGIWADAYLLLPTNRKGRVPGVVVFHPTTVLHIRQAAGLEPPAEMQIGLKLAERGYAALCPRCFIFEEGHEPAAKGISAATVAMRARRPDWTGMRKMLSDGQRALDVLAEHPAVDRRRLGVIGHSLGAKEALYTAAFDTRVKAAVFSEGGIGMASTNWQDPWYLGEQVKAPGFTADHHELLALCAPRAFLLLGGDSADGVNSEPYIEAAKPVYALYGKPEALEMLNHHGGHALPPKAEAAAYAWFERWLR